MRNLDYHTLQINPEKLEQPEARETRPAGREEPYCEEKKDARCAPISLPKMLVLAQGSLVVLEP